MTVSYRGSTSQVHQRPPQAPAPVAPTSSAGLVEEWRTALLPARLLVRAPHLAHVPRGVSDPVIDIPGWKAPEFAMAPLRRYLRWVGHDAQGWGLGVNTGNPERDSTILAEQVAALHGQTGRKVSLVGWSLGGVIARETARAVPHAVSRVITYGTPAIGGPTYTLGAGAFGPAESSRIQQLIAELDRDSPITVPITAIFTRRDRVVSWPACIDRASLDVEHVEVGSTHAGMGLDPDVWQVVATRLAPAS
jgi:pimeloyl-ACP methyl ester carboxylesterase